jgi:hypothetical protein
MSSVPTISCHAEPEPVYQESADKAPGSVREFFAVSVPGEATTLVVDAKGR